MKMITMIFLTIAATQALAGGVKCQLDNSCPVGDGPQACIQYTKNHAFEITKDLCEPRYESYFYMESSLQKNVYVWHAEYELCTVLDVVIKTDDQCNILSSEIQYK